MKLITAIAAVLMSASLTVPTVTQAEGSSAEVRLNVAAADAETKDVLA